MKSTNIFKNLLKTTFLATGLFFISSCSTDDDLNDGGNLNQTDPPIVLDCDFFKEDRVLTKNPNAAVDYLITCVMPVRADIVIEPGVVIEFEQDAGIEIDDFNIPKASLSAIGTSDKPVIFRGVKKEKGYWRGIMFDSNSPSNKLIYTRVEYAGGKAFNSNGDLGAVHVYASGRLVMENTSVSNSKSYGLNVVYTNANITLNNNTFSSNNAPAVVNPGYLDALNNTNDYKGNESDFVYVNPYGQEITKPSTWHKINVPYQVISNAVKHIRVKDLLTIEPGVMIEFGQGTYINVHEDGGGLKAVGTENDPIIFTGTSKVSKAWKGIYINSKHAENEIAFAEIQYSGLDAPQGNVWLWYNSLLNIHNVKFKGINGCGINYRLNTGQTPNPNLTIGENITVEENGCIENSW